MSNKLNIKDLIKNINSLGYTIDTEGREYIKSQDYIVVTDDKGYKYKTTYNTLTNGSNPSFVYKENPYSLYNIQRYIDNETNLNLKLLSKEYVTIKTKLVFLTKEGYKITSTWDDLKRANSYRIVSTANIYSIENIRLFLKLNFNNYELISEKYISPKSELLVKCKHGIFSTCWNRIQQLNGCRECFYERNSGDGCVMWKGGISKLSDYLRSRINNWKQDSFKKYGYKCDITGIHDDILVVHHMTKNFSEILYETLEELHMPTYQEINKYSEDQLKLMETKCIELHNKYGLGVCLNKSIHDEFHSIYGRTNNTIEQYEEFKNNKLNELKGEII